VKKAVYYAVETPLGEMRIHVHDGRPVLVTLPDRNQEAEEGSASAPIPAAVSRLRQALEAYFQGKDVPCVYIDGLVDSICRTPFEGAVLKEVARIPRGEVRSYSEIAELAGYPRAARAVGNVMHDNPFPIVIPCHRVIRKDGSIGGFGGAEGQKAWLLDYESRG